ncbi:hypothetical protein [Actinomycetospora termitidis]|uniref:AsnC family transcriptional regulator n=1 Tax=Actinomycetospora termitidis TaxID=3053470 RepID=A0ABT7M7G8_9PSEU|nr:hypothetical protein [Actinomycetospora sp. Odt1-22]MDL5156623.1 hypothetical protein [Actinomycetospora sp. Odt1-22]
MTTDLATTLTARDRAVLATLASGRGALVGDRILVDGVPLADQFVVMRLRDAGLLEA